MGYNASVYARQVKNNCLDKNEDPWDYLENKGNLVLFTDEQKTLIHAHLTKRNYTLGGIVDASGVLPKRTVYDYKDSSFGLNVFLTESGLYFSCPNGNGVMEASMTSSEFYTDGKYDEMSGQFAVFDPSDGGWL